MTTRHLAIVPLLLASAACAGEPDAPSVGGAPWAVEPVLSVGGASGDPLYEFGAVTGVDADDAGNVYAVDIQAQNVRVFDSSGTYLRTIGRSGSGPGELGIVLLGVFVVGDAVLVPDLANRRMSRFALDGTFIASVALDFSRSIPRRIDVTAGGRLLVQRSGLTRPDQGAPVGDPVVTLGAEGERADTLVRLPLGESVQMSGDVPHMIAFAAQPMWDSDRSGRLVTAMSDDWRFEVLGTGSEQPLVISHPFEATPVTPAIRSAFQEEMRGTYERQGLPADMLESVLGGIEFADNLPAFASVFLGPAESVWVQQVGTTDFNVRNIGSNTWSVFDSSGAYVSDVSFPQRFQPFRAMGDLIYGVGRDALDVQTVEIYRVVMG